VELGEAIGLKVARINGLPFCEDGFWPGVWNAAYLHGPSLLCALAAWLGAVLAFAALGGLGLPRPVLDGRTRCGWCGYILSGLREPRCPECGRRI
jgi:hypothetical protein